MGQARLHAYGEKEDRSMLSAVLAGHGESRVGRLFQLDRFGPGVEMLLRRQRKLVLSAPAQL